MLNFTSLVTFRKELHQHPEVSEHEHQTQERILRFLAAHTKADVSRIGNTGVWARFDSESPGLTVAFRADTDALPIQEVNDFAHRSVNEGISHKCGHDGHTAILLGLAMQLSAQPLKRGSVWLFFQPAEENGMGAKAILQDERMQHAEVDYIFALHNLPGYPLHTVVVKEQAFTGDVKSIIVRLHGKTAHAAEPEKGHNPAQTIADVLQFAAEHTHNVPESEDFFLITPIHLTLGDKAYGISAGYGEVHLTIRTWSPKLMDRKCHQLTQHIQKCCDRDQLTADIVWTQEFRANINHPDAVHYVTQAARQLHLPVQRRAVPFKWGEDFGLFTRHFTGAMFGIGAGVDTPALHNPDYDFPDDLIVTGVNMFFEISQQITSA